MPRKVNDASDNVMPKKKRVKRAAHSRTTKARGLARETAVPSAPQSIINGLTSGIVASLASGVGVAKLVLSLASHQHSKSPA
jgi:hypothetical protein